jgi:hypothetical protein
VDPEPGRHEGGLTNGNHTDTRSARCVETRTPGAASGPGKRAGRKTSTAPRPDSTARQNPVFPALPGMHPIN